MAEERRKPRIVSERRRKLVRKRPPENVTGHEWCGKDGWDVLMTRAVADRITSHCEQMAEKGVEAMGLLYGDFFTWQGRYYVVVHDVFTHELDASAVQVRFIWEGLVKEMDKDMVIVGWYHSHPGFSTFLSETDIRTQRTQFNSPHHVAIVVDPLDEMMSAFRMKDPDGQGSDYEELGVGLVEMGWRG